MKAIETALSLTQAYKLGIERFENNIEPENIDKDIIRKWIAKNYKKKY